MRQDVLARFGVDPSQLIGEGGEVWAYALDPKRVLRIYKGTSLRYLENLARFYASVPRQNMCYILPEVMSLGQIGQTAYSIERRLPGRDFGKALRTLGGTDRHQALSRFADAATAIQSISVPDHYFGEVLAEAPIRAETWAGFLWKRAQYTYAFSRPTLQADIPDMEQVMSHLRYRLEQLPPSPRKLVHGDFYPPNTYIDDALQICAIGDFGRQCVIGDPMLDVATSAIFLEFSDGYQSSDTAFMREYLTHRYGSRIERVLDTYRLYYAIYYSFSKYYDPPLYKWCTDYLRHVAQAMKVA